MSILDEMREAVVGFNRIMIFALAERFKVTDRIGKHKVENGLPLRDREQEIKVLNAIGELAQQQGLDPEFCKNLMQLIMDKVFENHEAIKREHDSKK